MPKPGWPRSLAMPLTSRLVEVPTRVQTPAVWDTYDSGIRAFEADMPMLAVAPMTIGMKTATTAVLFTNGAMTASTANSMRRNCVGDRARPSRSPMRDSAPLFWSPAASTNMAATVIVAELLNPDRACAGSTSPVSTRLVSTSRAMASMRSFSVAKSVTATRAIAGTRAISSVIARGPGVPACAGGRRLSSACSPVPSVGAEDAGGQQRQHEHAQGDTVVHEGHVVAGRHQPQEQHDDAIAHAEGHRRGQGRGAGRNRAADLPAAVELVEAGGEDGRDREQEGVAGRGFARVAHHQPGGDGPA